MQPCLPTVIGCITTSYQEHHPLLLSLPVASQVHRDSHRRPPEGVHHRDLPPTAAVAAAAAAPVHTPAAWQPWEPRWVPPQAAVRVWQWRGKGPGFQEGVRVPWEPRRPAAVRMGHTDSPQGIQHDGWGLGKQRGDVWSGDAACQGGFWRVRDVGTALWSYECHWCH